MNNDYLTKYIFPNMNHDGQLIFDNEMDYLSKLTFQAKNGASELVLLKDIQCEMLLLCLTPPTQVTFIADFSIYGILIYQLIYL